MLQDVFAVAHRISIELKSGLICDQRLEERLPLKERQARDIPAADMQEIESLIDQVHSAFAVR